MRIWPRACAIASFGPSALVWDFGADYDFTPSLYVKVNTGTAFRLPTDEELFANDPATSVYTALS